MSKKKVTFAICFSLFLLSSAFAPCTFAADVETVGDLKVDGQIWSASGGFKFPDGTTLTSSGLSGLLFNVGFVVDNSNSNPGDLSMGAIKFGTGATGEAIASQRIGSGNVNGLDLYTNSTSRLSISNSGNVGIGTRTPAYLLDVAGNIHASTALSGASLVVTGSARADYGNFETTGLGYYAVRGYSSGTGATRGVQGEVSSATGMGGKFINTAPTGKAISAVVGGAEVMNADAAGIHAGPGMTGTPLAYGFFLQNADKQVGSSNLDCSWVTSRYECTITGQNYVWWQYVTNITPSGGFAVPAADSGNNKLVITFYDKNGSTIQPSGGFAVTIYKP